jgi:predicted short-subunit dehydrogenase-like oxidoreductase (DUF2520 family)
MDSTVKSPVVAIVGQGNVATHLLRAFEGEAETVHVNSHTLEGIPHPCDFILIAVKDDAIPLLAERINDALKTYPTTTLPVVAHTSGSTPLSALTPYRGAKGVFYPLQTFSANDILDYREIPFFIEGEDETIGERLSRLASLISRNVHMADSSVRKELHIAAVFACNYTNHLISIADRLLQKSGLDYKVLMPLIRRSIGKLDHLSPHEAQTGPAIRDDRHTIGSHLAMLSDTPALRHIYETLADSIKQEYSPE